MSLVICVTGCRSGNNNPRPSLEWSIPKAASLSEEQVRSIALGTAVTQGYDLTQYDPPKIFYNPVPGHWTVFYGDISESSGGKDFFVIINDTTREASFCDLEHQKD